LQDREVVVIRKQKSVLFQPAPARAGTLEVPPDLHEFNGRNRLNQGEPESDGLLCNDSI
jgi:hypothetical protein